MFDINRGFQSRASRFNSFLSSPSFPHVEYIRCVQAADGTLRYINSPDTSRRSGVASIKARLAVRNGCQGLRSGAESANKVSRYGWKTGAGGRRRAGRRFVLRCLCGFFFFFVNFYSRIFGDGPDPHDLGTLPVASVTVNNNADTSN